MSEEPGAVTEHAGPDCCDFARRISDLHDGRWPVEACDCAEVEAHLAECPRCAELRDDYRAISRAAEVIRDTPVAEADCGRISGRVRARLRRRVFVRRLWWTGAGVGFAAAAAAVLFAVILHEGPRHPDGGRVHSVRAESPGDAHTELAAEAPAHDVAKAAPPAPPVPEGATLAERVRRFEQRPGVTLVGEGDMARQATETVRIAPPAPPLLGVLLKDVQSGTGAAWVTVVGVVPASPAETAGLRVDDVIISINGASAHGRGAGGVAELIRRAGPGVKVTISFGRAGEVSTVEAVLAGTFRPDTEGPTNDRAPAE